MRILRFLSGFLMPRFNIVLPPPGPGGTNLPGAKAWEDAMQSSPAQPAIPLIVGGPEGSVYGTVGAICVDDTGRLWVKSTDSTVNTGWKYATLNAVIM